jgi:hypothetical protein
MTHPIQPLVTRLYDLSRRASRHGHHRWAVDLEQWAINLKRKAWMDAYITERDEHRAIFGR